MMHGLVETDVLVEAAGQRSKWCNWAGLVGRM